MLAVKTFFLIILHRKVKQQQQQPTTLILLGTLQQTHWSYYRRPKASVLGRGVRTRVVRLQDDCTTTAPLVHPPTDLSVHSMNLK